MKKILFLLFTSLVLGYAGEPQKATFAAGCFWCLGSIYENVPGVTNVVVGYSGGHTDSPTYEDVCREDTGHSEAVDVTFDPDKVSYEALLRLYYKSHDPTNGEGVEPDFGDSYRPKLFYRNDEQKASIQKIIAEVQKDYPKPIATQVVAFTKFWPAEDYHQSYVRKHPGDPYVTNVSIPRVQKTLGDTK